MIPGIIASVRTAVAGPTFHAFGADVNGQIKALVTGSGAVTFARSSTATVTDWEGLVKACLANELRVIYARRVENIIYYDFTTDYNGVIWDHVGTASDAVGASPGTLSVGGTDIPYFPITFGSKTSGNASQLYASDTNNDSTDIDYTSSVWLRVEPADFATNGNALFRFATYDGAETYYEDTVTDEWQRFSIGPHTLNDAPPHPQILNLKNRESIGRVLEACAPQGERVTGQTDQNPSEYVSVGVESGQYHGAMVDGVAYYDYENGNTVVSNKVIEAVGSDLTTAWGALYEAFATTNYCTHSEEHDNAAWTKSNITIAADSIAAPDGATTADTLTASAGNGTCLDSITLASSDVTYSVWLKRLTGTGNIDLTVDGGTGWTTKTITSSWARYDIQQAAVTNPQVGIRIVTSADAIYAWGEQLEVKDVPTSYVPTSGATATRTADDGDAMFDTANWYGTEGTWYLDIWFGDFIAANYAIFGPFNGSSTVFYSYLGSIKSFNGLANSRVDLAIGQVTDNRFRLVADFELGDTLELGERDVDGSGSFAWDATPASYDQIFVDNSVLNVFRLSVTPMRIRDLYGHTTRQGKTWVEANL